MTGILGMLTPPLLTEYIALVPGLIVVATALLVVLLDVFHRAETSREYLAYFSSIGLGASATSCWWLWDRSIHTPVFHGMLYADRFGLFFAGLCTVAAAFALMMSPKYLKANRMDRGEYYMLILLSVAGMIFMANSADLLSMFVALEIMSIPAYCIAAFLRLRSTSAEAGLKYFILGAFSTALMLYGVALLYGLTGSTNLEVIAGSINHLVSNAETLAASKAMLTTAVVLVIAGFAFKIAAAPFHIWAPDVYTGSPTPAAGLMATGIKAAALAGMLRVLIVALYAEPIRGGFWGLGWIDFLFALAIASIVLGNLVAIAQSSVKRMLAYSSVAHAGYILVGIVAANAYNDYYLYNDAVLFYIVAYTFGTLGAFGTLAYLHKRGDDVETYQDLNGIGFKYPYVGLILSVCILSSAGIPPTAGFLGKFYVFRSAIEVGAQTGESSFIVLSVVAVLFSVAGMFYYLRVLVHLYMKAPEVEVSVHDSAGAKLALVAAAALSLYLGIFPNSVIRAAREAVVDLQGAPMAVAEQIAAGRSQLETPMLSVEAAQPAPPLKPLLPKPDGPVIQ